MIIIMLHFKKERNNLKKFPKKIMRYVKGRIIHIAKILSDSESQRNKPSFFINA